MIRATTTANTISRADLQSKIARLESELEKAQAKINDLDAECCDLEKDLDDAESDCVLIANERDEARKWARKMLHEATIAQQNHVSAVQREMITGEKLFDRETRLTTLAKELGRVQGERDAEVEERKLLEDKLDYIRRQVSICNPPDPYAILIDIWKFLNRAD